MGGDDPCGPASHTTSVGSPPRGRGRLVRHVEHLPVGGLTPAWAGTTSAGPSPGTPTWAHPRVGGDDAAQTHCIHGHEGSPPRGRGRRLSWPASDGGRGLTPAWAGTTGSWSGNGAQSRAHPRVGGDDSSLMRRRLLAAGSPPRGRGRRELDVALLPGVGLTPAWAGTTSRYRDPSSPGRAHPRVGGDDREQVASSVTGEGSPPRGRGRLSILSVDDQGEGLTPAWAGTTDLQDCGQWQSWAHPRVGGDDWMGFSTASRGVGSPPRGRGRREARHGARTVRGLTPAWAGTTRGPALGSRASEAHPRVGGDDREPRLRARPFDGLTPAWAGTTARHRCCPPT